MSHCCSYTMHLSKLLQVASAGVLACTVVAAGAQSSPVVSTGYNSGTPTSLQTAGRLLDQAGFGPTSAGIAKVESLGVSGYLNQQFAQAAYQIPLANPKAVTYGDCGSFECETEYFWWNDVLFGQDQLRQRVAFDLSRLFVVSLDSVDPRYMPNYLNTLANDAFGNWFTLMHDVALSPAMGTYLNMANSSAPGAGQQANENFARELMQLFSIGTYALNADGSVQMGANGNPVANYNSAQVQSFALAYTGWTFANNDCSTPSSQNTYFYAYPPGQNCPMVALEGQHSTAAKTLMNGTVLPAGQSAVNDLNDALQNVFQSPSLPPFVSRYLIQSLVKSNPTPAYISRVSAVFTNDGNNVRGDMKAVLTAILTDPEARAEDAPGVSDPTGGKLRDPIVWWAGVMRALQGSTSASLPNVGLFESIFDLWLSNMDEVPRDAPSVFSFYSPNFQLQGTGLYAPEFQNENANTVTWMALHLQDAVNNSFNLTGTEGNEFSLNLGPGSTVFNIAATQGATGLTKYLDALMMHGEMTQDMFNAIVNAVRYDDPATMARCAVYLVATSPQYRVIL